MILFFSQDAPGLNAERNDNAFKFLYRNKRFFDFVYGKKTGYLRIPCHFAQVISGHYASLAGLYAGPRPTPCIDLIRYAASIPRFFAIPRFPV